jgi:hypothetical protein
MNRVLCVLSLVAGLLLTTSANARAQATTSASAGDIFANLSFGGQFQGRDFVTRNTFVTFNETAVVDGNQTVGRGPVVNLNVGYHLTERMGAAIGLWMAYSEGESAFVGAIPDPLFFGRFTVYTATGSGLPQRNVGLDLQFFWTMPVARKIELAISGGPTIMHVRQELASFSVDPGTQVISATAVTEQKVTAKAANVGADVRYRLNSRYRALIFARYVGGQVDLPSASNMTVGGVQVGGGVQYRF